VKQVHLKNETDSDYASIANQILLDICNGSVKSFNDVTKYFKPIEYEHKYSGSDGANIPEMNSFLVPILHQQMISILVTNALFRQWCPKTKDFPALHVLTFRELATVDILICPCHHRTLMLLCGIASCLLWWIEHSLSS
jgi:hypothetical protein